MSDARRDAERPSYEQLDELIAVLRARIAQQDRVIAELRERLAANSRNGSRSPSSDGYRKPPVDKKPHRIRSLRQRSGRKAGGQDGHEGVHLERRAAVDRTVAHAPQGCSGCGGDLTARSISGSARPGR